MPEEITSILGVEPTNTGVQGQPRVNVRGKPSSRILKESDWSVSSPDSPTAPLQEHFDSLMRRLTPALPRLKDLPAGTRRTICLSQISGEHRELIILRAATLTFLAELGVDMTIDVSC